jgi:fructose-bisphosphate aldolase / 2-amino-3,7-dideoxy-D-threo-hept-6-ulosonate synthase
MNTGKEFRWKHIFRNDGKAVIVAMDHSTRGAAPGLENYLDAVNKVAAGGADAVLTSYGNMVALAKDLPRNLGYLVGIPSPPRAEFVREAALAGADALKFTHFGGLSDANLNALQPIAAACEEYGIVFMPEVVPQDATRKTLYDQVVRAARLGQEAGGDFIKTAYTGSVESFKEVVKNCPVPIVILGGEKMESDRDLLQVVKDSIDAGGAGICIGRNIFQHKDPTAITAAICKIVHEGASVEEALKLVS